MRVGVLGGGRWGQALARLAIAAGHQPLIAYEGKKPPHILESTDRPADVPAACGLVFVATSAAELRDAVRSARPGPKNRVVVAGRGIEPATGKWLCDVVLAECDALRVGALAGPAPAEEILNGGLCAGVVASPFEALRKEVVAALHSRRYRVYETDDLVGVSVAGAAVPVLATMIGMATSLGGAGVGLHALVVTRGLEEVSRLAKALGGRQQTIAGLAGLGDLVAAQSGTNSPYARAGQALARPGTIKDAPPPPVGAARALMRLAEGVSVELPLIEAMVTIADRGADPVETVAELMGRRATVESR
jgi:glycerol-3-phosphate dehydrogenase (NAD(P)+)